MLLFRIIDFFELMQAIRHRSLRVPSAQRFSDQNELVGLLFAAMHDHYLSPRTQQELDELIEGQDALRESLYISSWTQQRDSIAMWEIYSACRTGVQIAVESKDIESAFKSFLTKHSVDQAHGKPANHDQTFFWDLQSGACDYEDISEKYTMLMTRFMEFNDEVKKKSSGKEDYEVTQMVSRWRHDTINQFKNLQFLKDICFSHEREFRFSVGAVRRNDREYEDCKRMFRRRNHPHLRYSRIAETGDNIFIDFDPSLIQGIYLDGRAPDWLRAIQSELIGEFGLKAERSPAYSSFLERGEIRPWSTGPVATEAQPDG